MLKGDDTRLMNFVMNFDIIKKCSMPQYKHMFVYVYIYTQNIHTQKHMCIYKTYTCSHVIYI